MDPRTPIKDITENIKNGIKAPSFSAIKRLSCFSSTLSWCVMQENVRTKNRLEKNCEKPVPSMTKGEINPPTVQIAMPKEMAFDRIGVGNNSAALLWSKIAHVCQSSSPCIPVHVLILQKSQPIPIK